MHIHKRVSLQLRPAAVDISTYPKQNKQTNKHAACRYKGAVRNEDQLKIVSAMSENGISHKPKTTTISMYPKDVYQVYRIRCLA